MELPHSLGGGGATVPANRLVGELEQERARLEQALQQTQERFRDFAEAASDWLWEMDEKLRFSYFSERYKEVTGVDPERMLGRTREESRHPDDHDDQKWRQHQADLEARRPFRDFRIMTRTLDGKTIHQSISGKPVFDRNGTFKGYRGTGRDISIEVGAQLLIAEMQQRLIDAIESLPVGFALFDSLDRLVLCNERFTDLLSWQRDALVPGITFPQILRNSLEAGAVVAAAGREEEWLKERCARRRSAKPLETLHIDGRWTLVSERQTADGGTVQIRLDITEQKKAEAALRQSEDSFRNLIEGSIQGILIHDRWKLLFVNRALATMFGYDDPEELLGGDFTTLLAAHEVERATRYRDARLAGKTAPNNFVLEGIRKDGQPIWLQTVATVVDWHGERTVQVIFVDITEQRKAEENLRQALEAAEQANRAKSDFLAKMSHEFRTPLNAVIGFAEVLQEQLFGPLGDRRYSGYARNIVTSGRHLLDLVSDILDMSKIESGHYQLELAPLDIRNVIREILRLMKPQMEEKRLRARSAIAKNCPVLMADEKAIRQVLLNLLSNAMKFTPEGGAIRVEVRLAAAGGVRMTVSDTGIGIAEKDIDRVLSPFTQVHHAHTSGYPGTGLGLPIVKSLVEMHGGTLTLASKPGSGTRVIVDLP